MPFLGGLPLPFFGVNISVGEHVTTKIGPLTINLDTVWATGAAMVVIIVVGFLLRRQVTSGVPGRLQLVWETGVLAVRRQVEGSIGERGLSIVPLALTLFVFIFVCNFIEIVAVGSRYEFLITPTADVNLTLGLALFVIVLVHIASIRSRGIVGYLRHYMMQPFPVFLMPLNLFMNFVEEVSKPITLALRLFGNLFSGALMLSLIAALGAWTLHGIPVGDIANLIFNVIWKMFDVFFIGPIQAFIFALLTILYFDAAMAVEH